MRTRFTHSKLLIAVFVLLTALTGQTVMAQTGVLNYQDSVVNYNPSNPPTYPPANTLVKWIRTVRFSWNSTEYKCYFYNNVQFRLRFPKSFSPAADGKTYPLYLFFHGVGEAGPVTDNEFQFSHGGQIHLNATDNGTFDAFLLYPQSAASSGGWSQAQVDAMYTLITTYLVPQVKVDINRIIVSGLSGGGDAAWTMLESHPTLAAAGFIMSSANINDLQYVPLLKYTPIWLFQGGLDQAPDPSTTAQVVSAYNTAGGNLTYTLFPNDGHDTWDDAWNEPGYFPWMLAQYKQNPWALHGRTQYCPTDVISDTLGVTAGFPGYQWRKNDTIIQGATSNTYVATSLGTYDCSILQGSVWSSFSPTPVVISIKQPTVSPNIKISGLASDVVPAPDGTQSVNLVVPSGYVSYTWQRVDSPAGHGTILSANTDTLKGATPGQYAVEVTEQFGCSSSFSSPFTVINTNGANPPSVPTNLQATALSQTQIKLAWNENPNPPTLETQFEIYQASAPAGPYKLIGFAPALTDSFIVSGLNPKTIYFYEVRAIDNTAASPVVGPSSTQTQSDVTPPTAPTNLTTGTITQTSVQLNWTAATDNVGVTNYGIYVNGNLAYTIGDTTSFTVYNLVNSQNYSFTVKAMDFAGNSSPFSNQVTAIAAFNGLNYSYYTGTWSVLPNFNTLTPVVSGVVPNVTLNNALSEVDYGFTWTGFINVPVTGTYTFQTISDDGSKLFIDMPYSFTATPTVNNDGAHGPTTVNSKAMTLTAGVHTFCAVYFQQGGGVQMNVNWKTPQSGGQFVAIPNSAFAQIVTPPGTAPAPPSQLTATAATSKKINLSWQNNATNATGFQIYRATSASGPYATVATVKPNRTSYGDSSLNPQTTYYYKITAINQYGESKFNAQDSASLSYNFYGLYTANNLAGIATSTPSSTGFYDNFNLGVTTFTSDFALTFNGYINILTPGNYTFYTSSDDGSNLYIDGKLVVNNDGLHGTQQASGSVSNMSVGRHAIQVNYFQQGGGQFLSASYSGPGIAQTLIPDSVLNMPAVSATTLALPSLPAAPTGLSGVSQGPTHVALTWTDTATNATGYQVWRSPTTNTGYVLAASLPVTSSYVDSGLVNNSVYFYKVLALNEAGNSAYSNEISVTTSNSAVTTVTLSPVAAQALVNDSTVTVPVTASSSGNIAVTFSGANLPAFASVINNGNGSATLSFAPNSTQLGTYNGVILTATDAFGGTASDTFNVTVTGRNQTMVQLTFSASPEALDAGWNGMGVAPNTGAVAGNFTDVNGNPTTDSVVVLSNFDGGYNAGENTGNNSGIFPDNELRNFYFGSSFNNYSFKVTGLNAAKKYALILYAGYPWGPTDVQTYGNLITNYTIGSQTQTLNVANNTNQTIQFAGLSPDATGAITVTLAKPLGSAYCLINDMQILSYDAPVSQAALIAPSNLTAWGASNNSVQLNWVGSADTRTGFEVWRSTAPNGTFSLLKAVGGSVVSYKDSALPANSTYFYEVREVVNGNEYSNFSNIAGGSVVQFTANVSLNSQTTFAEAAPWNDVNTLVFNGFTLPNLEGTARQSTGINFNVVRNFTSFNSALGVTTGHNTGVVPDTVMQTFYYCSFGDTAVVSVSGLSQTGVYNFGFYAGTSFASTPTVGIYQIGNQAVQLNAFNNTTQMVFINGVKPDSTGTVYITFYCAPGTGYAMFNSLTIQGMPSPVVIGADSLGTSGVIATALANNNQFAQGAIFNAAANTIQSGVSRSFNNAVGVFPNPFVDNVTVSLDVNQSVGKFALVVVDVAGRVVMKQEISGVPAGRWTETLNLSRLARGTYFIQAVGLTGSMNQAFKLVKVR